MNAVTERLNEERRMWRQDPPDGFTANLTKNPDGTLDLFRWECEMPGPRNSIWEQGTFEFTIEFNRTELRFPPIIRFTPTIFHPNVCGQGYVCSDLLDRWPHIGIKQLIFTLQSFLETPNPYSPMNGEAASLLIADPDKYNERVRLECQIL